MAHVHDQAEKLVAENIVRKEKLLVTRGGWNKRLDRKSHSLRLVHIEE